MSVPARILRGSLLDKRLERCRQLVGSRQAAAWELGDLANTIAEEDGVSLRETARRIGMSPEKLIRFSSTAKAFEVNRRRFTLAISVHAEVRGLPASEADVFLDRIEAGELSRSELRAAVQERTTRGRIQELERECAELRQRVSRVPASPEEASDMAAAAHSRVRSACKLVHRSYRDAARIAAEVVGNTALMGALHGNRRNALRMALEREFDGAAVRLEETRREMLAPLFDGPDR